MSNNDKLLLTQGVATIKCQVIVKATDTLPETVLSEENSVKDWTYTDERYVPKQGFIGQFVARTLSGNLQNISDDFNIEGREIELRIGVVSGTSTNWYSLGNFIITDPTDNNVIDNTKFEAMDYTKLFNKKFNGDFKDNVFTQSYNEIINDKSTVTAIWLAKYCCAQVGVEFGQTAFTNSDFIINQNPFLAGETCRDVLKEISKLAYSWVRIGWDNKCYIDFEPVSSNTVSEENTITNNHYYTLETRKELYGPINNVVVGMSGIDGESHSEKDPNAKPSDGEHTIYIYDNPLTNTFELRALAQKKASKLFGLQFAQVSTETIGHPWLQANEKINVKNMENVDNYTYPFNRTIKFTGHIRTTIDSMADSDVEATLAYESEIMKSIKKASATVDKQNGVISLLVEDVRATQEAVENIDGTINPVGVGEGEYVYVEDASENELMYLQIEGKSTQETRSGYNLIGVSNGTNTSNGITYTTTDNGKIILNGTTTSITKIYFPLLKSFNSVIGESYTLQSFNPISYNGAEGDLRIRFTDNALNEYGLLNITTSNSSITTILDTKSVINITNLMIRIDNGVTLNNFEIKPQAFLGRDTNKPYEQFGVSPSPDYPSDIESVGYENLLDISTFKDGYTIDKTTGELTEYNTCGASEQYIEVQPNTEYTYCFNENCITVRISQYKNDKTHISRIEKGVHGNPTKYFTFTTPIDCYFIRCSFNYDDSTSVTQSIIETVKPQLYVGSVVRPYIDFGKYGIEVKTVGRNIWNEQWELGTLNANTGDNITITTRIRSKNFINVKSDTKYYGKIPLTVDNCLIVYYDNAQSYIKSSYIYSDNYEFTTPSNCKYIKFTPSSNYGAIYNNDICINISDDKNGEYAPYKSNTSLIVLNEPLRSLPNGVKDIAYIKNGKLYVDRYITSIVLNGSETWQRGLASSVYYFYTNLPNSIDASNTNVLVLSNYFKCNHSNAIDGFYPYRNNILIFNHGITDTLSDFKTWLSEHPTQVDYELATPVTEDYGELPEKPSTFKGVNNIFTNNNPQPKIHVEYVRDNAISKYVEQHVSELRITENEIKTSVSSLEGIVVSSNSETQSALQEIGKNFDKYVPQSSFVTLERNVTQLQTDTYTKTEINTKLADGSVTKVMTTSGTFDEDGMHYAKTNAPTSSTINERGVEVDSTTTGQELLFAGYDNDLKQTIVRTENLTVRKYFVVGDNSRIENYGNGGGIFII